MTAGGARFSPKRWIAAILFRDRKSILKRARSGLDKRF